MYQYKAVDFFSNESINVWKGSQTMVEPKHTHEFIEITYIYSGEGVHTVNDISYRVTRGDMLFINFGQTHSFTCKKELTYVNILLLPEFISNELVNSENAIDMLALSVFEDFSGNIDNFKPFVSFRGTDRQEVEALIDKLLNEYNGKQPGYNAAMKSLVTMLLVKSFREMRSSNAAEVIRHVGKLTPDIFRYIEQHCFEKISVSELARRCFYNPSYFSRMFKECFGKTITEFINEKRIEQAKSLLADTDMSIETISSLVGYSDKKRFYKVFRQITGTTPGNFRRKNNIS